MSALNREESFQKGSDVGSGPFEESVGNGLSKFLLLTFMFSVAVNILMLVSPLYMIQVYDRVMTSGSFNTLLSLSILAIFLLAIYAFAEAGRRRALALYGRFRMDEEFSRISGWILSRKTKTIHTGSSTPATLQDVSRVQSAINSGTIIPIFDLPFSPLFLALMFMLHPLIGSVGLLGAASLVIIAIVSERMTSERYQADQAAELLAQNFLIEVGQSKSAVIAMGMRGPVLSRWNALKTGSQNSSLSTSSLAGLLSGLSRSFRQILQTLILGMGAYLALKQELSPGAIVAGSIIMGRALSPIDQIVGGWKQLALAAQSIKKLQSFKKQVPVTKEKESISVSSLNRGLNCRNLSIGPPGSDRPLLEPFDFRVDFGELVVIVGPSGSGKSCLLQSLSSAWPHLGGEITLGNRNIDSWVDEDRGRFVGYLPQSIELLPGSVASNISRFQSVEDIEVEEAAIRVGFHELFMAFPQGYSTEVGRQAHQFSAGQKQAIGLSRAVFGSSCLLLLDEPTANLDAGLARRFITSLDLARARGVAIIVTTHDARILPRADRIFSTQGGRFAEIQKPSKSKVVVSEKPELQGRVT